MESSLQPRVALNKTRTDVTEAMSLMSDDLTNGQPFMNRLFYGDCLTIMSEWPSQFVDLIYLDPPFNSNRQYNAIYKDETGRPLPDQIDAFCDMWVLDDARQQAIRNMPVLMKDCGIDDATVEFWRLWMRALQGTQPDLLAYLSYMAERLMIMRRILKSTGTIYLHCDPTASHYIKALMDAIFRHRNFRNEIVWQRTSAHNSARRWGPIHDTLLMYSKTDHYVWNRTTQAYDNKYIDANYRHKDEHGRYRLTEITGPGIRRGESGQSWRGVNPTERGRHWAVPRLPDWVEPPADYRHLSVQQRLDILDDRGLIVWPARGKVPRFKRHLDESAGMPLQDMIWDIPKVSGSEDLGYQTQKPRALLDRIIRASSNPGDIVLDPFCGCATTMEAADHLGRHWIGIDIAIHAIKRVARVRLDERLGLEEDKDYVIEGVPRDLEGAHELWERDKYHFQKWAVEQVEGFVTTNRAADGGVDGRLYFAVPDNPSLQSMVVEVKGGSHLNVSDLRAFKEALDNDTALMAGLITLSELAPRQVLNFDRFAADAGTLSILGIEYPRMQTLTVEQILHGYRFRTPTVAGRHEPQPVLPGTPASVQGNR